MDFGLLFFYAFLLLLGAAYVIGYIHNKWDLYWRWDFEKMFRKPPDVSFTDWCNSVEQRAQAHRRWQQWQQNIRTAAMRRREEAERRRYGGLTEAERLDLLGAVCDQLDWEDGLEPGWPALEGPVFLSDPYADDWGESGYEEGYYEEDESEWW